jgi:SAM-dependent methyltransferase
MSMSFPPGFDANIARFTGFADHYDRHRPSPPADLAKVIAQFIGEARPRLVVDLGSGTGLSTRYWAERAERVIGIEPTPDMRRQAEDITSFANISYRAEVAHATRLPAQCAQVVVCMQSFHWMAPQETLSEVARILVPGGIFAACDYDWPPATGSWEADAAYEACMRTGRGLEQKLKLNAPLRQWDKDGHLTRMHESNCFRYVREMTVNQRDLGNGDRLVGLLLSQGYVATLLKAGLDEEQLGLPALRAVAQEKLGPVLRPWLWSARIRLGIV